MRKINRKDLRHLRDTRMQGIIAAYKRAQEHTADPDGTAFLGLSSKLDTSTTRAIDNRGINNDAFNILYTAMEDYTEENSTDAGRVGRNIVQVNATTTLDYMQHESLVLYINDIINRFQQETGDRLNAGFDAIDSAHEGYTSDGLDCCESDMAKSNPNTQTNMNYKIIPVVKPKVSDISTHLANILTPPTHMYGTIAPKDKMQHAKAVAGMMNVYASKFGHYTEVKGTISDLVKYNLGGIKIDWKKQIGLTAVAGVSSQEGVLSPTPSYKTDIVFEGATLKQMDVRNLFWDTTCGNVAEAAKHGQYVGVVSLESLHTINSKIASGEYFGDTLIPSISPIFYPSINTVHKYYNPIPILRDDAFNGHGDTSAFGVSHHHMHGAHGTAASHAMISSIVEAGATSGMNGDGVQEIIEIYIKLQPRAWHLPVIDSDDQNVFKMYKIILLNSERILYMDEFKVGSGSFPIIISTLESGAQSNMQEKSVAAGLIPIQQHINQLMKKDQLALSKSIAGGLLLFDKNIVELNAGAGAVSGVVAAKATSDKPMRDAVHFVPPAPYSSQAFNQIIGLEGLLETIAPSNNDKQVADLQRATELQAAATIQAGKKRWLSVAKSIDDCLLAPTRQFVFHLMLQNEKKGEILSENGEMVPFSLNEIVESGIEFTINNGLQGLDRVLLGQMYEKLIQTLIQAQMTGGYNMEELINYRLSLAGDQTDFTAFKIQTALDNLPPEAKQMAAELYQAEVAKLQQLALNGDKEAVAALKQMSPPNPGNFAPQ